MRPISKFLMEKTCKYHSNNNLFIYLDSKNKEILSEKDVIEIQFGDKNLAYFSAQFINKSSNRYYPSGQDEFIFFNNFFAKKNKISEGECVKITNVYKECSFANSISIEPLTWEDWEILVSLLELNLDTVQNTLLDQIKVVYQNQIFPIWVESQVCIFVKLVEIEQNKEKFASINGLTRVIVKPFIQSKLSENLTNSDSNSLNEWSCCLQIELQDENKYPIRCGDMGKCTTLTTVEIGKSQLGKLGIRLTSDQSGKYLISLKALKSPMQSMKTSSTVSKKFLQSLDNSFSDEYYSLGLSNTVYAVLNISDSESPFLRVSQFLARQLGLFELNSKVFLNALKISDKKIEPIMSSVSKKKIKLKASFNNINEVRESFMKFIDDQSECLCPIILTHNMMIELATKNQIIVCSVILSDQQFVAINTNTLLNDLLSIDIELTNEILELKSSESFRPKFFSIKPFDCAWFKANVDEIMSHLNKNLFDRGNHFNRNLVLSGLKGSGKTTLCKYVCNLISKPPYNSIYHYINCQQFMNKTPETFYEQLKIVYQECIWYSETPCLVVLENLDLLIENKSHTIDPSSMLYHAQIVEALKELLVRAVWENKNQSNVVTIVTISCPFNEMPSIFHCIDEHGLFSEFYQIKYHSDKNETKDILDIIAKDRSVQFDYKLVESILNMTDGFVFKDIEKLIDKIIFNNWTKINEANSLICLDDNNTQDLLYNFVCINLMETKLYKAQNQLNWSLVGGLENIKNSLVETLIWPIKYKDLYSKFAMKQSGGVLLYGPSGCGKTLIASALANESKFNFISVKGPELLSKYIGNSEQNVRELFNKAEKAKPCIIFFDEFDALAPKRGHDSTGVTDRVVNQLLVQLDGVEKLSGVYLLAATSRPDLIDQALLRPGRLDNYFYIGYPDMEEIIKIFKIYSNEMNLESDVDFNELSVLCEDLSGADIKSVVCDAFLKAFHRTQDSLVIQSRSSKIDRNSVDLRKSIKINRLDFVSSIESVKQTINKNERIKQKKLYENWTNKKSNTLSITSQSKARVTLA